MRLSLSTKVLKVHRGFKCYFKALKEWIVMSLRLAQLKKTISWSPEIGYINSSYNCTLSSWDIVCKPPEIDEIILNVPSFNSVTSYMYESYSQAVQNITQACRQLHIAWKLIPAACCWKPIYIYSIPPQNQ